MKYHASSALLLFAGAALETLGFGGGVLFLAAGVGCETWFWMRLARRRAPTRAGL
jgi:hypothetical protein